MKKRNGFTLIELLAVIVILAVIALIAVPKIIEILNKSRISAAEDSTYGIVEAAESYVASFMLQNQGAIPSENLEFSCNSSDGCVLINTLEGYNITNLDKLNYKGKKVSSGNITISENGNKVAAYGLLINNFICNYGDGVANCIDSIGIGPTKENPPSIQHEGVKAIVYLDPTDFTHKCDKNNINSDTGTKTGCMKWYAYAEDDNTYTMILDHNTTDVVAWNSKNINSEMKEIKLALDNDTKDWDSSLYPKLISAKEISTIVKNSEWEPEPNTNNLYFQNSTIGSSCASEGCYYAWLYDRTGAICKNNGCLNDATGNHSGNGYWTSSPVTNHSVDVWYVSITGSLNSRSAGFMPPNYGVRPVITIPKSFISN